MHKGLDIAAPTGAPVKAVAPGKVVFSSQAGGYGNLVVIDHGNGFTTRYAHNRTLLVSVGDTVRAGQEIAHVGSTGRSTGPHLHFEVLRNGYAVDPLAAIANFPSATKLASRDE
jgi:murein DD-endopeptidase MepM/ murein hydrolase activator NlpD